MTRPCVDILLSTYNGQAFLEEQINSILDQTHDNWRLIIRDDGSTDTTMDIIERFADMDSRVVVSASSGENLGVVLSFVSLLKESTSPYFAFCDQDDFWLSNKLETLTGLLEKSREPGPALVYSDLVVVNAELSQTYPSFMAQQHFSPEVASAAWSRNLLQNTVVGCACLGNQDLRRLVLSNAPDDWSDVIMHDWWIALAAAKFGRLMFEPRQTVLYRQHTANQVGAKGTGFWRYVKAIRNEKPVLKVRRYLDRAAVQADAFYRAYGDKLAPRDAELLGMVSDLQHRHGLRRVRALYNCYLNDVRMQSQGRDWLVLLASVFG